MTTMFPMLHGGFSVNHAPEWCLTGMRGRPWSPNYEGEVERCFDPSRRMMRRARQAGYVVGASTDIWLMKFNDARDPHHVAAPGPCGLEKAWDRTTNRTQVGWGAWCTDMQCFGRETNAEKLLKFNDELFGLYKDTPKFLVSWLMGAHASMEEFIQLEDLLFKHLKRVLHKPMYEDAFVVLMGDHGSMQAHCDYRSPFLGVLAPRKWELSAQGRLALEALRRNADGAELVTPWDLYATLRHLVHSWPLEPSGHAPDHFGMHESLMLGSCNRMWLPALHGAPIKTLQMGIGTTR